MANYPPPSPLPVPMRPSAAPWSDVVDKAAAILARETPAAPAVPSVIPTTVMSTASGQGISRELVDDLQRRAMALVSDLFSALGARQPGPSSLAPAIPGLPWRRPSVPAPAGSSTSLTLRIENLEDRPVSVSFYSSDLLSDAGRSIPSVAVSFDPPILAIGAGQEANVTAKVDVPLQSIPGAYSGLIQAAGLPDGKAVITVDIC